MAVGGDSERVLELRRGRAVLGHRGPAVGKHLHLVAAGVDHGLDGEEHALAQGQPGAGLAVMQDARRVVEHPADAVAAEIAHHRKPVVFGVALDGVAEVAQGRPRADDRDAAHHRLVGDIDETLRLHPDLVAEGEHAAGIAVPALQDHGDVDVQDVAGL